MNSGIRVLAAATMLALLAGCSSPEYIISTTSGVMITTHGQPKLDDKTGMYTYKDSEGRKATIKKEEVKQVMQR
jgi:hypothetical protein